MNDAQRKITMKEIFRLLMSMNNIIIKFNMTSFFRFVDKQTIYRWNNLIRTCPGECD